MTVLQKSSLVILVLLTSLIPVTVRGHEGHEHFAPHGGIITPYKDGHCETVLLPKGGVRIYLTDAAGHDLPATLASDVSLEIEGGDKKTDTVIMTVSASGDFWEGPYRRLTDAKGIVHVAFVLNGDPVVIDLPVPKLVAAHLAAVKAASDDEVQDHTHTEHAKTDQHDY